MKLLIATDGYLPRWDGISRFLNEVIPHLQEKFEVTVVAPDFGKIDKPNYNLVRFEPYKKQLGDYHPSKIDFFKLNKLIKDSDLVFSQCLGTIGAASIFLAKKNRTKSALFMHMIEWELFPKGYGSGLMKRPIHIVTKHIGRFLYNMCNMIIVPSHELVEILTWMKVYSKKRVVHLGVDHKKFAPPRNKQMHKKKLGLDGFVVGYVGRLAYEKDLPTLYRAFRMLKKKIKTKLLIVGSGREEIHKMFEKDPDILVTGSVSNAEDYYKAMDVHVLPSLTETTSLVTLEAMSSGVPILSTPVGYVKEYIKEGENGFLFPKKGSYHLYRKLIRLQRNPKKQEEIGKAARKTILEKFSWEHTAKGIMDALEEFKQE